MSDIGAISGYGSNPSLVDILTDGKSGTDVLQTSTSAAQAEAMISAATARKANNAYGGGITASEEQDALRRAIAELQGNVEGTLTFAKIAAYQKELEDRFTTTVRADLLLRGVTPDTDFTLKRTSEGNVEVVCDDPAAKAAIEDYLTDNPEVVEDFSYIQALANLERAKQGAPGSMMDGLRNTRATIQAQAVALLGSALNGGMNYSSLMASFNSSNAGNPANFFTGIDYLV